MTGTAVARRDRRRSSSSFSDVALACQSTRPRRRPLERQRRPTAAPRRCRRPRASHAVAAASIGRRAPRPPTAAASRPAQRPRPRVAPRTNLPETRRPPKARRPAVRMMRTSARMGMFRARSTRHGHPPCTRRPSGCPAASVRAARMSVPVRGARTSRSSDHNQDCRCCRARRGAGRGVEPDRAADGSRTYVHCGCHTFNMVCWCSSKCMLHRTTASLISQNSFAVAAGAVAGRGDAVFGAAAVKARFSASISSFLRVRRRTGRHCAA